MNLQLPHFRYIYPPTISSEKQSWGIVWGIVPPSPDVYDDQSITVEQWEANFTFFIDNIRLTEMRKEALDHAEGKKLKLNETKTLYVGFRECSKGEKTLDLESLSIPLHLGLQINTTLTFRGFTTSCNFIEKDSKQWENRNCR
ncbi:unnamed protein product, partial [Rodentolepis nana]|uniref:Uncharacterized protein n=1 Tax=Rodentolepis nana TaxID=102285 RepID=A0A0R3TJ35_RODNA